MTLDKTETKAAYNRFRELLTKGVKSQRRVVGFPGGSIETQVWWMPDEAFWYVPEPPKAWGIQNRYWMAFGVEKPDYKWNLPITCEINPAKEKGNFRIAGCFCQDEYGRQFLAHSGKIGGGKKGIGKSAFRRASTHLNWEPVLAGDRSALYTIVCELSTPTDMRRQIATFVRHVAAFKRGELVASPSTSEDQFFSEFQGVRRGYKVAGVILSRCDHGLIVEALKDALISHGYPKCWKDVPRDLYLGTSSKMSHLFEVKTSCDSQSIYTAIGQLMLHGASNESPLRRVLVLPDTIDAETRRRLIAIGFHLVTFKLKDGSVSFTGLSKILT